MFRRPFAARRDRQAIPAACPAAAFPDLALEGVDPLARLGFGQVGRIGARVVRLFRKRLDRRGLRPGHRVVAADPGVRRPRTRPLGLVPSPTERRALVTGSRQDQPP